jgi:DNA recombination protein RmuC
MGFKTLAIQKRSSEVWKVLGAVKTEFDNFAAVLSDTQKRLEQANDSLDKLVGVRTRQIQRKLSSVTSLAEVESKMLLGDEEE